MGSCNLSLGKYNNNNSNRQSNVGIASWLWAISPEGATDPQPSTIKPFFATDCFDYGSAPR